MLALASEVGATRVERPSYADFHYISIPVGADPVEAARRLAARPDVIYAEPDGAAYPLYRPNDEFYRHQWHLQKLGMEKAWDINRGGSGSIVVAVLDTGIAYTDIGLFSQAPDLGGTRFVPGYDFVWDDDSPVDTDGHGTHVSGTIAQTTGNGEGTAGMAFNASLMPVKVLWSDWDEIYDAPFPFGLSTVARGIRFAVDGGAKVINMSLGGSYPSTATLDALEYAVRNGVFVAIAAGNNGDEDNAPEWPASYAEDIEGVMAVAALDYNYERAFYSHFGDYVEIAAPGGDTRSWVDQNNDGFVDGVLQQTLDPFYVERGIFNRFRYSFFQGTSMACPHVAGFAALLMDQGVTSPAAVEAAIKRFATDLGPTGRDDDFGYGALNPRETLRGLGLAR